MKSKKESRGKGLGKTAISATRAALTKHLEMAQGEQGEVVSFKVPQSLLQAAKARSKEEDRSLSSLIRSALKSYLDA